MQNAASIFNAHIVLNALEYICIYAKEPKFEDYRMNEHKKYEKRKAEPKIE